MLKMLDEALENLAKFTCGICHLGFDTDAQMEAHKLSQIHVSLFQHDATHTPLLFEADLSGYIIRD